MSNQNTDQNTTKQPRTARQLLVAASKRRGRLNKLEKLPADLIHKVLELVRMGVYDHVAATSIGVAKQTWVNWMAAGAQAVEDEDNKNIFAMFYLAVQEARSDARILAEMEVHQKSALTWLRAVAPEDWCETQKLAINAQHALDVSGGIGFQMVPPNTIADGLSYLEELGYLQETELGSKLLTDKKETVKETDAIDSEFDD